MATNTGVVYLDKNNAFVNVSQLLNDKTPVVNAILVDKNQNIWYGNGEALFKITEANGKFKLEKFDKKKGFMINSITSIKEDKAGNIWIGTYGDGAYKYNARLPDGQGKKFSRVDFKLELYKQTVLDFYFDDKDNVWMATLTNGVAQYNTVAKTFNWLTENEGLSNNHVQCITQDKSGNYWFGTSGGGVCNYFGKQFTNYDKTSGLAGNFIYSIFRDSKQRLWIGNSDKGVSVFDSSKFVNYNAQNNFADVKVKAINEDNEGNIYIGTDGQGVFVYDGKEFKPYEGLTKKYIRAIVKDKTGSLWIATAGTGLFKIAFLKEKNVLLSFSTKD